MQKPDAKTLQVFKIYDLGFRLLCLCLGMMESLFPEQDGQVCDRSNYVGFERDLRLWAYGKGLSSRPAAFDMSPHPILIAKCGIASQPTQ